MNYDPSQSLCVRYIDGKPEIIDSNLDIKYAQRTFYITTPGDGIEIPENYFC